MASGYHFPINNAIRAKVFEDFTVDIADHQLRAHSRHAEFVIRYPDDHDVKFIGYWIRHHIRKIDNKSRSISFRQLKAVLNRYYYTLENPSGNRIDVVLLHRSSGDDPDPSINRFRVGQIGFPSWSKQVSKSDLKHVRELTNLTSESGVDAAAFFDGLDPMQSLIVTYHDPLMRLASR